jgi:hypothetical protein
MTDQFQRFVRYRNYAEELRIIADESVTGNNRDVLMKVADDYDRMADSLEAMLTAGKARKDSS